MSYCVNCGVELDRDAVACPLCQTPVVNPVCPPDAQAIPNFPLERQEVEPVDQRELAILLTAMVVCAGVCCGLLNLFLWKGVPWALFVAGACAVLWVWLVPPLLLRKVPSAVFLLLDLLAVGGLLVLIAAVSHGMAWFTTLAMPVWAAPVSATCWTVWNGAWPRTAGPSSRPPSNRLWPMPLRSAAAWMRPCVPMIPGPPIAPARPWKTP